MMMLDQETNLKRFLSLAADVFKRTRIAIEPTPDGNVSIKPEVGLPADFRTSLFEAILGLDRMPWRQSFGRSSNPPNN